VDSKGEGNGVGSKEVGKDRRVGNTDRKVGKGRKVGSTDRKGRKVGNMVRKDRKVRKVGNGVGSLVGRARKADMGEGTGGREVGT